MPFTKHCGALIHVDNESKVLKINSKYLKAHEKHILLQKKAITSRTENICEDCVKKGLSSSNEENEPTDDMSSILDVIKEIKMDIKTLRSKSYDLTALLKYDAKKWVEDRPKKFVKILKIICNITEVSSKQDFVKLALVIETIYGCWSPNLILPISFTKNLFIQLITHSKQIVQLEAKLLPAGTFSHISHWLHREAMNEKLIPKYDIKAMFDNGQVLGKNWNLHPLSKMPSSVITVHGQIVPVVKSHHQWDESLKPKHWWFKNTKIVENGDKSLFRTFRDEFLNSRITFLLKNKNGDVEKMAKLRSWFEEAKFCKSCGRENVKTFRVCRVCNGALESRSFEMQHFLNEEQAESDDDDEITHVQKFSIVDLDHTIPKFVPTACNIICGEPNLLNPNSYENISEILRGLGYRSGTYLKRIHGLQNS